MQCISKGKGHKKFEFGNKVFILYTQNTGVIVGTTSFLNPYDGHTLDSALEQHHAYWEDLQKHLPVTEDTKEKLKLETR